MSGLVNPHVTNSNSLANALLFFAYALISNAFAVPLATRCPITFFVSFATADIWSTYLA